MTDRPRLALNMIVKNETAILARCLAAIAPWIDAWVICDTGSTDGTPDLVRAVFAERGIPGELHSIPFEDFSQARNRALELCRASSMAFDYVLFADADMELVVDDPAFRSRLEAPAYVLRQTGGASYWNLRIVRRDHPCAYRGATHEFLDTGISAPRLSRVRFVDHATGSSRAEKYTRDRRLLERSLESDPTDARAMFYLAQTLRESGEFAEAERWYEKRARAGGWEEEAWYAEWMLAECRRARGDVAGFVEQSLCAFQRRPTRAEPLHRVARHHRLAGQHEIAMLFAEAGARIPYPAADALFVDDHVYVTGFREELSIAGFYCADAAGRERGRAACADLSTCPRADSKVVETARQNLEFYARPLTDLVSSVAFTQLEIEPEPGFHVLNPSICAHESELRCIVRTVNYRVDDEGICRVPEVEAITYTRNFLAKLDARLGVEHVRRMEDHSGSAPARPFRIRGFEDCRLFHWRGAWWASATTRDRTEDGLCAIALLELDDAGDIVGVYVQPGFEAGRHEKNWLPFIDGDVLGFVYTADPTVILRCDDPRVGCKEVRRSKPSRRLDHLRGGSQLVRVASGWLYLTHELIARPARVRTYLHRFVRLDDAMSVAGVSAPFRFRQDGIEFCAGLTRDPASGDLLASFGVGDRSAWIARFSEHDAVALTR